MIFAGTQHLVTAKERGVVDGELEMYSAASSVFLGESTSPGKWLIRPMRILPFEFSEGEED